MNATPTVTINADDAVEIIDALEWVIEWFAGDPDQLADRSLRRYSFGLFTLDELAGDLKRFVATLGERT